MILDDPFDDPPGLPIPDHSPEPTKEQLDVSVVNFLKNGEGSGKICKYVLMLPKKWREIFFKR